MAEDPPGSTTAKVSFESGFLWRIEAPRGAALDQAQLLALRDALREVGRLHAARMEHPPLTLSFAHTADILARRVRDLARTSACTLPLAPLAVPSGAMGYLHLSAWPALRAALDQRGIAAEGPP
jgi:hypothetical protein